MATSLRIVGLLIVAVILVRQGHSQNTETSTVVTETVTTSQTSQGLLSADWNSTTSLPVEDDNNCTTAPPVVLRPPNTGRSSPQSLLYIKLMDEYGPRTLRPVKNQSQQMRVALSFRPTALIEMEEREQILTLQISMGLIWIDENLTWDPEEHEGVTSLVIDTEHIWAPDVILLESIGETFTDVNNGYTTVEHTGLVTWFDIVTTTTFCKLLIKYFPFDVQHCSMTFTSWNYDLSKIDFIATSAYTFEEMLSKFTKNGMWNLSAIDVYDLNHTFGCTEKECLDWPSLKYVLEFQRAQSTFYMMNILLPCFLLSLLNLLVFILPTEAGEKVSFVMTNVLALVLFQQLVATMLPPSGDDTPIFSTHVFWMIVFGTIAITWTVFVIVIYFMKKRYPKRLFRFLTSFKCLYSNLQFGRKEASTRRYVNLARSRLVLDDLDKEAEGDDQLLELEEIKKSARGRNGAAKADENGKVGTMERWTDDGVKIYRANKDTLPVDASKENHEDPYVSTKERIRMLFCGHCGQINAAKMKIKDENFTFDPEDERLWQETACLLDKFMAYTMVFLTLLVYLMLVIQFVTHDPTEYRQASE